MELAVRGSGPLGTNEAQVDPSFQSVRASLRPTEYNWGGMVMGHYRVNLITGATVSLTAASPIASFRWNAANAYAVLKRVEATVQVTSSITAATLIDLECVIARGFSASDSSGTSTPPGTGLKNRSTMGNSLIGDLRVSTTAALTAGTRTLDTVGFGFGAWQLMNAPTFNNPSGASQTVAAVAAGDYTTRTLYAKNVIGQYPVVFGSNEGFIVRNVTAGPVTGSIRYVVTVEWAEVGAY